MRIHKRRVWVVVVLVLLGATLLSVEEGATQQKKRPKPTAAQARKDSIEAARVDSLRSAQRADSLQQVERALAQHRADSLKALELRTVPQSAFGVGERLVFDVNYGFVTAGEAVLAITGSEKIGNRKCYRVEVNITSVPSFSLFYKVEDRYLTFIDMESLAPWRFEQHIREGSYRRDFVAEFDQHKGTATTTDGGSFETPQYVHDIMSAFYYVRALDLRGRQKGDQIVLQNFYKDKTYELVVKFLGRQELEVAAGTFKTVVVEPLVREGGLFKSEGRIVVWLTDDDRKLPVRVNTKVVIGSIDTELREYSGIAGPLPARIK